jgi:hypothetical protein
MRSQIAEVNIVNRTDHGFGEDLWRDSLRGRSWRISAGLVPSASLGADSSTARKLCFARFRCAPGDNWTSGNITPL